MRGTHAIAMVAGFALDAVLGDPRGWPHVVRLIGKQIELEEGLARTYIVGESSDAEKERMEFISGAAIAADVALLLPLVSAGALKLLGKAHPALPVVAEAALFYQLIAARALRDESMAVHDALVAGDVEGARKAVAMIVGRDTDSLDAEGIARAAVETVAENTSDGVVAPLLFMGAGGAPAALFYKAVNTLDSMIGYKNERYLNMGRIAAKLDDAVNLVPARVSGALMCAAAKVRELGGAAAAGGARAAGAAVTFNARRAWSVFKRDRLNHSSPNSAHTEAACAGALGVQLGGPNKYFGRVVDKPTIGDDIRPVEPADIERANDLMYTTALLALALSVLLSLLRK